MKKIIQILKNNSAYLAMKKGKGEIVVSHASDEAILIASAFFACPKTMLVIKDSLYQAQLLYQELYPLLHQKVAFFPCDESLRVEALAFSGINWRTYSYFVIITATSANRCDLSYSKLFTLYTTSFSF